MKIKTGILGCLLALVLTLSLATPALAAPQPPHQFWGQVKIGDQLAEEGTTVSAKIGGVKYASTTTDAQGRYGYSTEEGGTGFFKVPADDPDTKEIKEGGVNGDTIKFYVADVLATTFTFQIGGHNERELAIEAPLAEPNISVSPTSKNFGDVTVGSSNSPQTVTVSNLGTANLLVETITITGANADQFTIQNDNCSGKTIAQNGSATLQVVFSPTSTGAKSATLNIPSNDPDEAKVEVSLSGTGVAVSDGGGGWVPPTYYTDTNLFGTEESFHISSSGKTEHDKSHLGRRKSNHNHPQGHYCPG